MQSVYLLGNNRVWKRRIKELQDIQDFCLPDGGKLVRFQMLTVSGKGKEKTMRLHKSALPILKKLNPCAYDYYMANFDAHHFSGAITHVSRNHRLAETVAMCMAAGIAVLPWKTFDLRDQNVRDRRVDRPYCYLSRELKSFYENEMKKTEAARKRAESINPDIKITEFSIFVSEENVEDILKETKPDYIIDAIDTVPSKTALIIAAHKLNIPIVSSMGTGNKLDPSLFRIVDISKTDTCPLAKAMRKMLREKGIAHTDVLYSSEKPIEPQNNDLKDGRRTPASISFVPSVAGLLLGGHVIRRLIENL
jgi:hypothetical protein